MSAILGEALVADAKEEPTALDALLTLDAFLEHEAEPAVSLWGQGLLAPETINILAGEDGVGKTALVLNLVLSLAAGREFLGFPVAKKCRVLLFTAEGNDAHLRQRIRDAAQALGLNPGELDIRICRAFELFQIGGDNLQAAVSTYQPDLVVLDTIGYFFEGEENSASDWKRHVSKPLKRLARQSKAAFLLIQHVGKPNERSGRHRIRGTSAQSCDPDTVMTLDRSKSDKKAGRTLSFEKARNGPDQAPLVLRFDAAKAQFHLTGENPVTALDPRLAKVEEIVRRTDPITTAPLKSELISALEIGEKTAEALILEAKKLGVIVSKGRGFYGLPAAMEPTLGPGPHPLTPIGGLGDSGKVASELGVRQ